MEYASLTASVVIFFLSLSLLVMAWSKKPTKKHTKEIQEAANEIVQTIQEAADEKVEVLEKKMEEMEHTYNHYKESAEVLINELKEQIKEIKKQQNELSNQQHESKKEIPVQKRDISLPHIDFRDDNTKKIFEFYKKGYKPEQIAAEVKMNLGVVQVYTNLFDMNKLA